MTLLSIDPGLHLGWALFVNGERYKSGTRHLKPKSSASFGYAMKDLQDFLEHLPSVDLIVYEDVRRHQGTDAAHMYGAITGILNLHAFCCSAKVSTIPVKRAKKIASGNGNASKEEMIAAANRLYNLNLGPKDDNEADALCIGYTYLHDSSLQTDNPAPEPARRARRPSRP
jgi:Holliday junction resolvasome RuvABC endonuclease subunit